jgi:hypothetical protein
LDDKVVEAVLGTPTSAKFRRDGQRRVEALVEVLLQAGSKCFWCASVGSLKCGKPKHEVDLQKCETEIKDNPLLWSRSGSATGAKMQKKFLDILFLERYKWTEIVCREFIGFFRGKETPSAFLLAICQHVIPVQSKPLKDYCQKIFNSLVKYDRDFERDPDAVTHVINLVDHRCGDQHD